ncbi:MAG: cobamide remodeling phosphodiesterase CbiR [Syntrophobacteraceae bacterium]|jgi:sugar phosphate isomerase/epimerase
MNSIDQTKFQEDIVSKHSEETSLLHLKRRFPFRLATTSYIIPAPILPNLHFLGPYVDEVEIVLFESGDESNLPSSAEIREMARVGSDLDITYNIHLPADLFFGDPDPTLREKFAETALRFYERTLSLDPTLYILHLDSRRADGTKEEDQRAWIDRVGESVEGLGCEGLDLHRVAVENLEYPLERVLPLVERSGMTFCLDIGHLLRYGYDVETVIEAFLEKSSMVHLHGVNCGADHVGIEWIPQEKWETISRALQNYCGGVSLEVFALADLASSLQRMQEIIERKGMP